MATTSSVEDMSHGNDADNSESEHRKEKRKFGSVEENRGKGRRRKVRKSYYTPSCSSSSSGSSNDEVREKKKYKEKHSRRRSK